MTTAITIPHRFRGPPESGNGGYTCGVVAAHVGNPAEVTLRRPPPLETALRVEPAGESVRVMDGDQLIAEGTPATVEFEVPEPVSFDEAVAAAERSWIVQHPDEHPFLSCFTCGPGREYPDGQRVFVGPLPGRNLAAAPWIAHESLPTVDGRVAPEIVWAILDCTGGIGSSYVDGERERLVPFVLGRLAAQVVETPQAGDRCVAVGWRIGRDGRKLFAGSALFTDGGELLGSARATWIELA